MLKVTQDMVSELAARASRVLRYLHPLTQSPRNIPAAVRRLMSAWRTEGIQGFKIVLSQLPNEMPYNYVWTHQYKKSFTPAVLDELRARICKMASPPQISVLMAASGVPAQVLRQAIESVVRQLYPHWELCIVDDAATLPGSRCVLEQAVAGDSRLKRVVLQRNAGLAVAINGALEAAGGSYVVVLDPYNVLEPQALFRVAECIQHDNPDMVYSDEALLSEDGQKVVEHVHRPAFSLEYLRSCHYIAHVVVYRTSTLKRLGGMDVTLTASQDYDLVLRAAEIAQRIVHIPEILYLRRQRAVSVGDANNIADMEASRSALARHLARCGESAEVHNGALPHYFDVRYPLRPAQRVAIIIPTKNHGELVRQCIESIARTVRRVCYEFVVIDHASDDPDSLAYFDELQRSHQVLRYEGAFNFSAINNWAVAHLHGAFSHYLFCNNDITAIEDGWLERMMELAQMPDVGIVGAKLLYPDRKKIQHAGVCVGMYGVAEHCGKFMQDVLPDGSPRPGYHGSLVANREMSAVTGACLLMRSDAFACVGGYEENLAVGFGDVDLCLKSRAAGYRVLFCARAVLVHHESHTRGKSRLDPHPLDTAYFAQKWRKTLDQCDPFYNPHLTVQSTQWGARLPAAFGLDITNRVWQRPSSATPGSQP